MHKQFYEVDEMSPFYIQGTWLDLKALVVSSKHTKQL